MAKVNIIINQTGNETGGVAGRSREDISGVGGGNLVSIMSLTNEDNTGVETLEWVLVGRPPRSNATIVNALQASSPFSAATIRADVVGSYLIELIVNGNVKQRVVASIKTHGHMNVRLPASKERDEFKEGGWGKNLENILRQADRSYATTIPEPWFSWDPALTLNSQFSDAVAGERVVSHAISQETFNGLEWLKITMSTDGDTYGEPDYKYANAISPQYCLVYPIKQAPPEGDYVITADFFTITPGFSTAGNLLVARFIDIDNYYAMYTNVSDSKPIHSIVKFEDGEVGVDFMSEVNGSDIFHEYYSDDSFGFKLSFGVEKSAIAKHWVGERAVVVDNSLPESSVLRGTGFAGIGCNSIGAYDFTCYYRNIKCWKMSDMKILDVL